MEITCTILPVEQKVSLKVDSYQSSEAQEKIATLLGVSPQSLNLLGRSPGHGPFYTLGSSLLDSEIYAIVRCRGGVKGGFRKQLEKKGREFARSKIKGSKKKLNSHETKEIQSPEVKVTKSKKVASDNTQTELYISYARRLVNQGVNLALKKAINKQ
ncbi:unnamed protein product [Phytomonas sp. Hart1]|nr:unnamed protein product [Phytomonas sp. Hart1]|eukprot:CCW68482.1 unnamed protein product [Phytomonas sp. isolate Hart1]